MCVCASFDALQIDMTLLLHDRYLLPHYLEQICADISGYDNNSGNVSGRDMLIVVL